MLAQHARCLQKGGLLELLEFVTGYVHETPSFPVIVCREALVKELQRAARTHGDRALKLSLPPAWALNGIFRLTSIKDGHAVVGHRLTLERQSIPLKEIL